MAEKEPCLIGSKIVIRGQVSGSQDLIVEGRIEGRVSLDNRLTIEESGTVEADLEVADVSLKGELRGDLVASHSAVLHPTARVFGNIRAPRLIIEEGARFSGSVDMEVELPAGVRSANAA
jgi:cytoskeletal protein CcmA (bactofilin family)